MKSQANPEFEAQKRRLVRFLSLNPSTMLQASCVLGILRANICRYVAQLQREGKIKLTHKGICPISKHRAGYYSTNKRHL
jgi:hypothetical protein